MQLLSAFVLLILTIWIARNAVVNITFNPILSTLTLILVAAASIWFVQKLIVAVLRRQEETKFVDYRTDRKANAAFQRDIEASKAAKKRDLDASMAAFQRDIGASKAAKKRDLDASRAELKGDQNDSFTSRAEKLAIEWEKATRSIVKSHAYALAREKQRHTKIDAYGKADYSEWIKTGIKYFKDKVLATDPGYKGNFQEGAKAFNANIAEEYAPRYWNNFCNMLIEEEINKIVSKNLHSNAEVNEMEGIQYENHCRILLKEEGWEVSITKASGDQGVDLIATKDNKRVCIQCKRFASPVGNSAVQEVTAGKLHWHGTHGVVVSNAGFTKSAQALARSTGVLLMSHDELADLENRLA
jgi:restriction system protein